MKQRASTWLLLAGLFWPALSLAQSKAETTFTAFGRSSQAAVLGLAPEAAEKALQTAVAEIRVVEDLANPKSPAELSLGALNRGSHPGAQRIDPRLLATLSRALQFCQWSDGTNGPLGGQLYALWGRYEARLSNPSSGDVATAVASAACDHLSLDERSSSAALSESSLADLGDFAPGWAVDTALAKLQEAGGTSGWVRIGGVAHGFGPGPTGKGWQVEPPSIPSLSPALPVVWLRDEAYAAAAADDGEMRAGNEIWAPYLDQRKGQPSSGVLAVLVSADSALDAQGLAATLFALGSRDGQRRLGALSPRPRVLWILGSGTGTPLLVEYFWSSRRR
ncbi:MAG TPA: FAD:protein FMN transferase [Thermoanaerobaculia bacterium]|nr:FAD:protein FMN transferase [Thermoanaerobaculia bacterium]